MPSIAPEGTEMIQDKSKLYSTLWQISTWL